MEKQLLTEFCEAFGWLPIESKHSAMISFRQEESNRRLNIYFKNMTVAMQDSRGRQLYFYEVTLDTLEELLIS